VAEVGASTYHHPRDVELAETQVVLAVAVAVATLEVDATKDVRIDEEEDRDAEALSEEVDIAAVDTVVDAITEMLEVQVLQEEPTVDVGDAKQTMRRSGLK
jgi:hypothetical protein